MHELYAMYERARPVRLAGFSRSPGLLLAAHYGNQFQVLLVAVMALPLLFGLDAARSHGPRWGDGASRCWASTGSASRLAHAVLLRGLPHGEGIVIDVLVGTFLGDTAAYFGGRMFGKRPLAPVDLPEQDRRGPGRLVHIIAAEAVCFHEAMQPGFKDYARQIVANAKVLAQTLADEGFHIISGGTDTHLMLVDVFAKGMLGSEARCAARGRHHGQQERHPFRHQSTDEAERHPHRKSRAHHPWHEGTRDAAGGQVDLRGAAQSRRQERIVANSS